MNNILTEDDFNFLKELGRELKTQDTLYTAKPIFWQIQQKDIVVGVDYDYSEGSCLIIGDEYEMITDIVEAKNFLIDNYDISARQLKHINELEEIESFCNKREIQCKYTGYIEKEKYDNAFLTRKSLEKHIELNHYHYKNPVRFCSAAWRNPELQRLLEIVEKFSDVEVENA